MPAFPRRLDAALVKLCRRRRLAKKEARTAIRAGRVAVGDVRKGLLPTTRVNQFSRIELDGEVVHEKHAYYMMLNKPTGVVSARTDADKVCAVDILACDGKPLQTRLTDNSDLLVPWRHELSIAGRLDRSTTGLLLLTNDGHWMRRVTEGRRGKVEKEYLVKTLLPLFDLQAAATQFSEGLYLPDNKRICRPAVLKKVTLANDATLAAAAVTNSMSQFAGDSTYTITLCEGKRHQVKRMIHAVSQGKNRVMALHRTRIGDLVLNEDALPPGAWRFLSEEEVGSF